MKKTLWGLFALLLLAGGVAFAQNINKAVQLSQDPTGLIGYDTSNHVYFPGHILSTVRGSPAPTVTGATCGTTAPAITGTDFAGTVTVGTSATTSCVVTFGTAFVTAPTCVVSPKSTILAAFSFATSTTALTVTQTSTANNTFTFICSSLS
jgi:hypothetical protein